MSRFARLFGFATTASRGPSWAELRATTFKVVKVGCYIHVFREYVLEYSVVSSGCVVSSLLVRSIAPRGPVQMSPLLLVATAEDLRYLPDWESTAGSVHRHAFVCHDVRASTHGSPAVAVDVPCLGTQQLC